LFGNNDNLSSDNSHQYLRSAKDSYWISLIYLPHKLSIFSQAIKLCLY